MSASKSNILRRALRAVWATLGRTSPASATNAPVVAASAFAEQACLAAAAVSTEIAPLERLATALMAPEACNAPQPALEDTGSTAPRKRFLARPLAVQLAVTARRNVRKGKAARSGVAKPVSIKAARPVASTRKPKPVTKIVGKKRAPKRRHVWLSTQSRVIRPVASNIVALNRTGRTAGPAKTNTANIRPLRLAA